MLILFFLAVNKIYFWSKPSLVRIVLIHLGESLVDFSDTVGIYIYIIEVCQQSEISKLKTKISLYFKENRIY